MAYRVELLEAERTVVLHLSEAFDLRTDLGQIESSVQAALDQAGQPVYLAVVIQDFTISFSELISVLTLAGQGAIPILNHPKLLKIVAVPEGKLLHMALRALGQSRAVRPPIVIFDTLDEARAAIRQELEQDE